MVFSKFMYYKLHEPSYLKHQCSVSLTQSCLYIKFMIHSSLSMKNSNQKLQNKNLPQNQQDVERNYVNFMSSSQHSHIQSQATIENDSNLENKRKMSFSPMKNLRILQNTFKSNQQPIQYPPILISSLPSEQCNLANSIPHIQNAITCLLQNQSTRGHSTLKKRSEEEMDLILKLIEGNKIWKDLGFEEHYSTSFRVNENSNYQQMFKQICNSIVLLWSQIPNITETKTNQIYLILQGKSFQYIRNQSATIKLKIHENNDYIMIRKLIQNDYFVTLPPIKYKSKINENLSEKYQLMVDEKTLMGKISDQLYAKWIQKRLLEKVRQLTAFMRKIIIFENLPDIVFQQLSKFVTLIKIDENVEIISAEQKSKQIFFIKKGEVQFRVVATLPDSQKRQAQKIEILKQYDVFGMDTLHSLKAVKTIVRYSARAKSECELYYVDKRILAIVISSFEKEFNVKQKVIQPININSQITGQNYTSQRQELLSQNAERIKTSEKRIRDVKLQSYSRNKKRDVNTYIPQSERIKQRKVQIKPNQAKLRSSSGFKMLRSKSMKPQLSFFNHKQSTDSIFQALKSKFQPNVEKKERGKGDVNYNHLVLPVMQEDELHIKNHTLLSNSSYNQFQRIKMKSLHIYSTSQLDKLYSKEKNANQFSSTTRSFVPKVQSRSSFFESAPNSGKIQSELIHSYLQKKINNEIIKKAQQVLERKNSIQRNSIKNIKKFYNTNSFSPSKKIVQITSTENKTRKELTNELVDRMANMKEYPLLSLIQTQRKKMDSRSKIKSRQEKEILQKRDKFKDQRKAKINQEKILIVNTQGVQQKTNNDSQHTYPISSEGSKMISEQN